jgi:hypothetical protein
MLIIPAEEPTEERSPTDEGVAAANARLRQCIMEGSAGSLRNQDIDADLARAYGDDHSEESESVGLNYGRPSECQSGVKKRSSCGMSIFAAWKNIRLNLRDSSMRLSNISLPVSPRFVAVMTSP